MTIHCVLGARVNGPWALAIGRRLAERYGVDAQVMPSDDGIVVRLPDIVDEPPGADLVAFDPDEIATIVEESVGGSAMFASRFRECAARALLLPRRDPRRRTPLWQQRQRSAQLLDVAREFADFPITLEAARECLRDVFDVPGLVELMRDVAGRRVRVVEVETPKPSPFARSLLFGYVGAFLYEGDAPLAERRAAALALDSTLLGELLGRVDLRELLDPAVVAETERRLQRLVTDYPPRDVEDAAEILRLLGDLSLREAEERGLRPAWLAELVAARRAIEVRIAGEPRFLPIEDAGRVRDALGVALPVGIAAAYTEPVADPLGDLVARYARTHGPFAAATCAARFGLGVFVVEQALRRLAAAGRMTSGEFTPGGAGAEFCDPDVLRTLRRRSLAALRKEIEPVPPAALARFLPAWQQVGSSARGTRCAGERDRAARRRRAARLGAGTAGAARPGRRLLPRVPRRAVRVRRGGLGRRRFDRCERRLGDPRVRRLRPAAAPAARSRAGQRRRPRRDPGRARRRPGAVLPRDRRSPAGDRTGRCRGRDLGPGLGRPPVERHDRTAPGAALRRHRRAQGEGDARPVALPAAGPPIGVGRGDRRRIRRTGAGRHGRPLVPAARPRRRPDPPGRRARRLRCSTGTAS